MGQGLVREGVVYLGGDLFGVYCVVSRYLKLCNIWMDKRPVNRYEVNINCDEPSLLRSAENLGLRL